MIINHKSDTDDSSQKNHNDPIQTRSKKQSKTPHNQKKLTTYFPISNPTPTALPVQVDRDKDKEQQKLCQLKEQLQQKDRQIQKMREHKQFYQNKYSVLHMECKNYKGKVRSVLVRSLSQMWEIRRAEKRKIDMRLGYWLSDSKFVEGEDIQKLKNTILTKSQQHQKLSSQLPKSKTQQQKDRIKFALTFLKKQLTQKQQQLKQKQKDIRIYKDKLRLCNKQLQCLYAKQKWNIIRDNNNVERYLPLELIGKGGFGEVYRCFDLEELCDVAVKINFVEKDGWKGKGHEQEEILNFMKHVKRQVSTHKELHHPNIVQIKEILQVTDNKIVFVMDYCTGPQLSVYLKDKKCLQQQDAKKIIYQIFSALNYLNQLDVKVIHYDLKPSNIIFDKGIVKILDFGLCKLMDSQESRMELTSQGVGTFWYLPPETFDFQEKSQVVSITDKVDVWSAGVIFFELLYGARPFGNGLSQQKILRQNIIYNEAHKLVFPQTNPNKYRISKQAKEFISECLCYDPHQRIQVKEAYSHKYFKQ